MNNYTIKARPCPNCGSKEFGIVLTEGEFIIVRCRKCLLIYLQNIPDDRNIYEEYYDIEYSGKDYCADSGMENLREVYQINNQRINYLKQFKHSGKLLDIGSGAGLFLKTALDNGYIASGIDVSVKAVEFSAREFGLNASNKTADELVSENCKYDIISLWHVCEHFINPVNELKKIHLLLENDGICFIEVPNFNSVKFRFSGYKWQGGNHPLYHRSFFTEKTLRDTLRRSGFTKFRRLNISYKLPGKSPVYNASKYFFNLFAMDAFLDFAVWK